MLDLRMKCSFTESSRHLLRQQVVIADGKLKDLPSKDVNRRLLKALLEYAPTAEGKEVIASDIIAASEELCYLRDFTRQV